ncbi:HORMA domain-containing protein [Myxozyma melibiosi]|uniref:HORMA domain-containing protein n=1 Tax=Myxozyma melibiosi TaxID=54550 RepID=A0ABR1F7B8_9ASCO
MAQILRTVGPSSAQLQHQLQLQHQQQAFVSPRVSQDYIQTFLSASFGCLTFLRHVISSSNPSGLFADDNYDDERFQPDPALRDHVRLKLLKRGVSSQADLLLDWLERGIFDAIERKYLSAAVFAVFCDPARPQLLQESYTFSIDYRDDEPASLALHHSSGASLEVGVRPAEVRKNLQQLMRRFILLTQNLPPLPDSRFVSVQLVFNDSCPADYQPPGFRDASSDRPMYFALPEDSDPLVRESVGSLTAGWHAVALNLSCVPERNNNNPESGSQAVTATPAASQIAGSSQIGSTPRRKQIRVYEAIDDVVSPKWGIPNVKTRANASRDKPSPVAPPPPKMIKREDPFRPSSVHSESVDATLPLALDSQLQTPSILPSIEGKASVASIKTLTPQQHHQPNVPRPKKKITKPTAPAANANANANRGAAPPKPKRQKKHATSSPQPHRSGSSQAARRASAMSATTRRPSPSRRSPHRLNMPAVAAPTTDSVGISVKSEKKQQSSLSSPGSEQADDNANLLITCECGYHAHDDLFDLVECSRCTTWKHLYCYGFQHAEDEALKIEFICSSCRYGGEKMVSGSRLTKIATLGIFRRAVKVLYSDAYGSLRQGHDFSRSLAKILGTTPAKTELILRLLNAEGAVIFIDGVIFAIKLVDTPEIRSRLTEKYFNPAENIITTAELLYSNLAQKAQQGTVEKATKPSQPQQSQSQSQSQSQRSQPISDSQSSNSEMVIDSCTPSAVTSLSQRLGMISVKSEEISTPPKRKISVVETPISPTYC